MDSDSTAWKIQTKFQNYIIALHLYGCTIVTYNIAVNIALASKYAKIDVNFMSSLIQNYFKWAVLIWNINYVGADSSSICCDLSANLAFWQKIASYLTIIRRRRSDYWRIFTDTKSR
jgi:hypothetical protein